MADVARGIDQNPRVGDVQRAVRADSQIVQELCAELREIHGRDGRAGALVETAHRVDVGDPQRVAHEGGAFGTVEGDATTPPGHEGERIHRAVGTDPADEAVVVDRKSTRLNSSHGYISYAVFCLKKKKKEK